MDTEHLHPFNIPAMLDIPVPADRVRRDVGISMMVCNMNPAWIQDNGQYMAMDFTENGGYFFDSFGRPSSYFGFKDLKK